MISGKDEMINIFLPLLLTTAISIIDSNSTRPVPSRSAWNKMCLTNSLEKHGYDTDHGKQWGSSIDKALAKSMCTCRYEKIQEKAHMTFDEYVGAAKECAEEFSKDYMKSIVKYLKMNREIQ